MSAKISFVSLGCDKNLIDSEIMLGLIDEEGYSITYDDSEADIIIINSCGFIMDANREAIDKVLEMADYKREGNCKALIVTGCMAQRYKDEIFESLPEVDAVVGTGDFENIGYVIKRLLEGEKQVKLVTDKEHLLNPDNSYKRIITTTGGFSYLKIAEGCDNHCTYCTIPSLRGHYRSRTMESLVKEAEILAEKGVRELILIAQDTSLYGQDIYGRKALPELLRKLSGIEDIKWLRILYCYPENVTDELIREMAENPKVLHYVDMPIQHSENRILKLMGRRSTREGLKETINKMRSKMPNMCIRTTLITGFPSETEEEFKAQCDFIKEVGFDRLGVFTYSPEDGTPAAKMPNQIDEDVKTERKDYILQLQRGISAGICEKYVGKTLEVIVEGKIDGDEENVYCGRSYRDCYEIDGFVFFKSEEELLAGDFYNIKITEAGDYDLIGERVD
ncbi:MAG: 30S ribosomal protein S12 methylthiotransferase RimO [Clostridia bacterium]|nr:30S ribosomal protein S12 methylthiotransferase RimO [Clostridia bacterium]